MIPLPRIVGWGIRIIPLPLVSSIQLLVWLLIIGFGINGQSSMTWVRDWQLKQLGAEIRFT